MDTEEKEGSMDSVVRDQATSQYLLSTCARLLQLPCDSVITLDVLSLFSVRMFSS